MDAEWVTAAEALAMAGKVMPKPDAAMILVERACAGLIGTRAKKYVASYGVESPDYDVPSFFWYWKPDLAALDQNWIVGDFKQRNRRFHCEAYGVTFRRTDLVELLSGLERARKLETKSAPEEPGKASKGGRSKHAIWPQWVAELVAHVHENGIPEGTGSQGQEAVINAIEARLGGLGPGRTTVQPVVQAVLDRLRSAKN